jgi:hypothetical protein
MTNEICELGFGELDGVAGGKDMVGLGKVTGLTDINMGIFGTLTVITVEAGGKTSTTGTWKPA